MAHPYYQSWWDYEEANGKVNPSWIYPDPDQPRQAMNDVDFAELKKSIKEHGVKEPITVTALAKAPWVDSPENENMHFVIVSGHRRHRASLECGLGSIEIRVRSYGSYEEYVRDQHILNKHRSPLAPLEEGMSFLTLRKKGLNDSQIARIVESDPPWVAKRIALTRLAPDLKERLSPLLDKRKRLAVGVAEIIGKAESPDPEELAGFAHDYDLDTPDVPESSDERRYLFQRMLLDVSRSRTVSAHSRKRFINDALLKSRAYTQGGINRAKRRTPSKAARSLTRALASVSDLDVMEYGPEDMRKLIDHLGTEKLGEVTGTLNSAIGMLSMLRDRLGQSNGETSRSDQSYSRPSETGSHAISNNSVILETRDRSSDMIRTPLPRGSSETHKRPKQSSRVPYRPSIVDARPSRSVEDVSFYLDHGTSVLQKGAHVTLDRFRELESAGLLTYQRDGTTRPDHYPVRA